MAEQCTPARCQYAMVPLGYTHSWVYLSVFGLVLAVLALLVFRRRDVV
jgi:LPXTG-motif cell wall-anchored protein